MDIWIIEAVETAYGQEIDTFTTVHFEAVKVSPAPEDLVL